MLIAPPAAHAESGGLCFVLSQDRIAVDGGRELAAAVAGATCGSVLSLASGSYAEDITLEQDCSADKPLILAASARQGADLAGRLRLAGRHLVVTGLRVDGGTIEVVGDGNRVTRNLFHTGGGLILRGARSRIDHNEFATPAGNGIDLALKLSKNDRRPARENLIDRNYFRSRTSSGGGGNQEDDDRRPSVGIYVGQFSARKGRDDMLAYGNVGTLVEYNLFDDYRRSHAIHVKSLGNTIRGNTVLRPTARGNLSKLGIRHGQQNELVGNFLAGGTSVLLFEEHNRAVGNVLVDGAQLVVMAGGGEMTQYDGTQQRPAVDTLVAGNTGPLMVGLAIERKQNKAPASGTIVEAHNGPVEKLLEVDTVMRDATSVPVPKAVALHPGDVGLEAADPLCPGG